jgi:phosphocarrier protein HPr
MIRQTIRQSVLITNPQGFHLRPMAAFVRLALQYQCDVRVMREDRRADGKSVLELMSLAAEQGTELIVEVCGPDARDALPALVAVINSRPAEEPEPPER